MRNLLRYYQHSGLVTYYFAHYHTVWCVIMGYVFLC